MAQVRGILVPTEAISQLNFTPFEIICREGINEIKKGIIRLITPPGRPMLYRPSTISRSYRLILEGEHEIWPLLAMTYPPTLPATSCLYILGNRESRRQEITPQEEIKQLQTSEAALNRATHWAISQHQPTSAYEVMALWACCELGEWCLTQLPARIGRLGKLISSDMDFDQMYQAMLPDVLATILTPAKASRISSVIAWSAIKGIHGGRPFPGERAANWTLRNISRHCSPIKISFPSDLWLQHTLEYHGQSPDRANLITRQVLSAHFEPRMEVHQGWSRPTVDIWNDLEQTVAFRAGSSWHTLIITSHDNSKLPRSGKYHRGDRPPTGAQWAVAWKWRAHTSHSPTKTRR